MLSISTLSANGEGSMRSSGPTWDDRKKTTDTLVKLIYLATCHFLTLTVYAYSIPNSAWSLSGLVGLIST